MDRIKVEIDSIGLHLPSHKMGGQGRKTIIPLFSPKRYRKRCGPPKPLPLGEVALRSNDGEGKPGTKEPLRSDGQALYQSDTIAVSVILGQRPSPLSLVALLLASSPKGGAIGMSASFRLDAESPTGRKRVGLATEVRPSSVQPLSLASLDKAGLRLPASASLPLASCWPRPQQLLPVSATGGGRRRCP